LETLLTLTIPWISPAMENKINKEEKTPCGFISPRRKEFTQLMKVRDVTSAMDDTPKQSYQPI